LYENNNLDILTDEQFEMIKEQRQDMELPPITKIKMNKIYNNKLRRLRQGSYIINQDNFYSDQNRQQ
jgi:mRNA-degrading endonuclease RelE of RelBE toxin-antitoxin system